MILFFFWKKNYKQNNTKEQQKQNEWELKNIYTHITVSTSLVCKYSSLQT